MVWLWVEGDRVVWCGYGENGDMVVVWVEGEEEGEGGGVVWL